MPNELLVNKIDSLNQTQKKSVLDYINFLIYQNLKSDDNSDNKASRRLEYLDSLENKEITSRNVQEINQYISEIRNEERVF
ncbi:MAG: hypothetical protein IKP71_13090 [Candidatus Riflebacteria bacterium]|nr:hypothetical protein [Candidatus Riflebacteria bacterium]